MKATLIESVSLNSEIDESRSRLTLIAIICGILITGLVFTGYAYLRKRHAQQILAATPAPRADTPQVTGPAKAEIFVDEPLLEGEQTVIGGIVKNISNQELTGLSIDLGKTGGQDDNCQPASVLEGRLSEYARQSGPRTLAAPLDASGVLTLFLKRRHGDA